MQNTFDIRMVVCVI